MGQLFDNPPRFKVWEEKKGWPSLYVIDTALVKRFDIERLVIDELPEAEAEPMEEAEALVEDQFVLENKEKNGSKVLCLYVPPSTRVAGKWLPIANFSLDSITAIYKHPSQENRVPDFVYKVTYRNASDPNGPVIDLTDTVTNPSGTPARVGTLICSVIMPVHEEKLSVHSYCGNTSPYLQAVGFKQEYLQQWTANYLHYNPLPKQLSVISYFGRLYDEHDSPTNCFVMKNGCFVNGTHYSHEDMGLYLDTRAFSTSAKFPIAESKFPKILLIDAPWVKWMILRHAFCTVYPAHFGENMQQCKFIIAASLVQNAYYKIVKHNETIRNQMFTVVAYSREKFTGKSESIKRMAAMQGMKSCDILNFSTTSTPHISHVISHVYRDMPVPYDEMHARNALRSGSLQLDNPKVKEITHLVSDGADRAKIGTENATHSSITVSSNFLPNEDDEPQWSRMLVVFFAKLNGYKMDEERTSKVGYLEELTSALAPELWRMESDPLLDGKVDCRADADCARFFVEMGFGQYGGGRLHLFAAMVLHRSLILELVTNNFQFLECLTYACQRMVDQENMMRRVTGKTFIDKFLAQIKQTKDAQSNVLVSDTTRVIHLHNLVERDGWVCIDWMSCMVVVNNVLGKNAHNYNANELKREIAEVMSDDPETFQENVCDFWDAGKLWPIATRRVTGFFNNNTDTQLEPVHELSEDSPIKSKMALLVKTVHFHTVNEATIKLSDLPNIADVCVDASPFLEGLEDLSWSGFEKVGRTYLGDFCGINNLVETGQDAWYTEPDKKEALEEMHLDDGDCSPWLYLHDPMRLLELYNYAKFPDKTALPALCRVNFLTFRNGPYDRHLMPNDTWSASWKTTGLEPWTGGEAQSRSASRTNTPHSTPTKGRPSGGDGRGAAGVESDDSSTPQSHVSNTSSGSKAQWVNTGHASVRAHTLLSPLCSTPNAHLPPLLLTGQGEH